MHCTNLDAFILQLQSNQHDERDLCLSEHCTFVLDTQQWQESVIARFNKYIHNHDTIVLLNYLFYQEFQIREIVDKLIDDLDQFDNIN